MFQTDSYTTELTTIRNHDEEIHTSRPKHVDVQIWMFKIFIPLCACIIIMVNFIIVVSSGLILHRGQQPRTTYIFLGNVALSDLLMGIIVLFGLYYPRMHLTDMTCCVTMGFTVASTLVSFYSVGLIAIDRYLYILYGLQYQRYISPLKARLMILSTWLLGIIIGFLPAMGFRNHTDNGKLCWFVILLPPEIIFITACVGLLPLIWIIVLYSIILKHALKKVNELRKAGENADGIQSGNLRLFRGRTQNSTVAVLEDERENFDETNSIHSEKETKSFLRLFQRKHKQKRSKSDSVYNPSKWKAIKIVLFTTGSFFITWFPFYIASVLYAVCNPDTTPRYCDNLRVALASPLYILGLTNSILNPIIYAWWHNGFRESVKKLYKNIFCHKETYKSNLSHTASTRTRISALSTNSALNREIRTTNHRSQVQPIENPVIASSSGLTSGSELETSDVEQQDTAILKSRKQRIHKNLNENNN